MKNRSRVWQDEICHTAPILHLLHFIHKKMEARELWLAQADKGKQWNWGDIGVVVKGNLSIRFVNRHFVCPTHNEKAAGKKY